MNEMLIELKEYLDSNDSATVHLNSGSPIWISKVEKIYDDKWLRVLHVGGTEHSLINMDYVERVAL